MFATRLQAFHPPSMHMKAHARRVARMNQLL